MEGRIHVGTRCVDIIALVILQVAGGDERPATASATVWNSTRG